MPTLPPWIQDAGAALLVIVAILILGKYVIQIIQLVRPQERTGSPEITAKMEEKLHTYSQVEAIQRIDVRTEGMSRCLERQTFILESLMKVLDRLEAGREK